MVVLELEAIVLVTGFSSQGSDPWGDSSARPRVSIYVHLRTDPASQVPWGGS